MPTNREIPRGENQPQELDLDKILNDKGLVEFLTKYDDYDVNELAKTNPEKVRSRVETFRVKNEVIRRLGEVYSKEIAEASGGLIRLDKEDLKAVDEHLEKTAIENPEQITQLNLDLKEFVEAPGRIAAKEKEIKRLEQESKKQQEVLNRQLSGMEGQESALKQRGVMERALHWYDRQKKFNQINDDIFKIQRGIDDLILEQETKNQSLEQAKKTINSRFDVLRTKLFEAIPVFEEIIQIGREKAKEMVRELSENSGTYGSFSEMEQSYQRIEALKSNDYNLLEGEYDQFQSNLNELIKDQLVIDMKQAIDSYTLGASPFSGMERAIGQFIQKTKIGSREGQEARQIILGALDEKINDLTEAAQKGDQDVRAKIILLQRIKFKMLPDIVITREETEEVAEASAA